MTVITPLTGTIGAVVGDVDLTSRLDAETVDGLRDALHRWKVLFFRDQGVTPTQQVAFGRQFGDLTAAHPLQGGLDADHPEILVLDSSDYALGIGDRGNGTSYNNRWHTDVTFSERPPAGSILAAKVIPDVGGDTLWADHVDAYRSLSDPLRTLVDGLTAMHNAQRTFERLQGDGDGLARVNALAPVRHPVVRVHPLTGERALFVNPTFTERIEGLSRVESTKLLELLYEHTIAPERVVRWRWQAGDVAYWDNRVTSHYAAADYTGHRVMHRITLQGEPVTSQPLAFAGN
jgi:taurine dioxygenase